MKISAEIEGNPSQVYIVCIINFLNYLNKKPKPNDALNQRKQ
jgi:hypothetical protein